MNYRTSYPRAHLTPPRKHHFGRNLLLLFVVILAVSGYVYYALHRPLPMLSPTRSSLTLHSGTGVEQLTWPVAGQSAVSVEGTNVLQTHGTQKPAPIASVAKVITALTVLEKKPLAPGEPGPGITLTSADVALYNSYVSVEGSVVPVSAGEILSERQMLEAIMLPSANNLADSLAVWAFGSLNDYQVAATKYINAHGMHTTHVGTDASGFSPTTTSTASDLVILGKLAMDSPVLRQIVAENSTTIPQAGSFNNVNFLLGSNGIIGIKTGNTDQAGGVYLSASTRQIDGQTMTIITALIGAPSLFEALQNSVPLITSAQANFVSAHLLGKGAVVGEYQQPWGGALPAAAQTDLTAPAWRSTTLTTAVKLQPIKPDAVAGQVVGTATGPKTSVASSNQSPIILTKAPTKPTIWWRLLHPLK